jgi:F-type H+-transporting ATPase subunit epsilon
MAGNIRLEVVTPERQVVNDEAQIVMAPGSEGEFGVLIGHTPFMASLKTGTLRYRDSTGTERFIFVSGGFAEALPDKVTVLAESAERRREIDVERARSALERAQKRLASKQQEEIDYVRARAALERALYRIRLVESRSRG